MTAKERMMEVGIETKNGQDAINALESLLINFVGMDMIIIKIPINLLTVDETYQTEDRTERSINYLVNNFDRNKLMPILIE